MSRITKESRNLYSKKQEKISIKNGKPKLSDLEEGVPAIRYTNEGLVQYIRYKNQLYKRSYIKAEEKEGIKIIT
tara:strand:+ start:7400 stop:7621 length:222 start_codon:yes stop_codon:yes gene_type:complete